MITLKKVWQNSRLLFTDFDFSNYSVKSKYYNNSNKLVTDKTKDETAGVAIEEFFGLKPEMYLYLVTIIVSIKKQKVWIEMLLQQ